MRILFTILSLISILTPLLSQADSSILEVYDYSFEELLKTRVESSSGLSEQLLDAAAATIIVTEKEIQQRGYTSLADVLYDLPGFDIAVGNSVSYINAYQRGYRTNKIRRTLLMINGNPDNHLWFQSAHFSRQYPMAIIKRIEVLYGPVSAVHGPNAFLGVINIITKDGSELKDGQTEVSSGFQAGSWNTKGADVFVSGKNKDLRYSLGARMFKSDEPDLSDRWGFCSNDWLSNENVWGPVLDLESRGHKFGSYIDPSDDYGLIGNLYYKDVTLGIIHWSTTEGYGPQYAADKGQVNAGWTLNSTQFFIELNKEVNEKLNSKTLLLYRQNFVGGDFAEAIEDWDNSLYSYISYTNWASRNNSIVFAQSLSYKLNKFFNLAGELKYERKELTKAFDIPGYWNSFGSTIINAVDTGMYGFGAGIGHSTDDVLPVPPHPTQTMPNGNLALFDDIGGYLQGVLTFNKIIVNAGIHYKKSSLYGDFINPRLSLVYKPYKKGALKLTYGEASQEPPPVNLWGNWSGRLANPDLKPEKARNLELIVMYDMKYILHDASFFFARYDNVIKEEAENAGSRDIYGFEYRLRCFFPNFFPGFQDISGYVYYSYIVSRNSIFYNHQINDWEEGETELGDISPHKIHLGLDLPVSQFLNVNIRGIYVSERELYTRNPLRTQGKLEGYFLLNGTVVLNQKNWYLSFNVNNILDEKYFHPGIENADGGNDFSNRSLGFHNSLLPQPERNYLVSLTFRI